MWKAAKGNSHLNELYVLAVKVLVTTLFVQEN